MAWQLIEGSQLRYLAWCHPVLFGLWPILIVYQALSNDVLPEQLVFPVLATSALSLTLTAALNYIYKDLNRAAVIASLTIVAFFFFVDSAGMLVSYLFHATVRRELLAIICIFLLVLAIIPLHRATFRWGNKSLSLDFKSATLPLTMIAGFLFCLNAVPIILVELRNSELAALAKRRFEVPFLPVKEHTGSTPVDIYYVILDAFANHDTLKKLYGYDNSQFLNQLRALGFVVVPHSRSNHDRTNLSVTSSLNFQLMTPLKEILGPDNTGAHVQYRLLQNSSTIRSLRACGYKFINISSGYSPTDFIPAADRNIKFGWGNDFTLWLMAFTIFGACEDIHHALGSECRHIRVAPFERIDEIAEIKGPKFVLFHSLITHPPFVFDENGRPQAMAREQLGEPYKKDAYLRQLKFAQRLTGSMLARLVKNTGGTAIIIVQSDHGPYSTDWREDRLTYVNERMRNLSAFYFPPQFRSRVNDTFTPVNTFRLILNELAGTEFELLPDTSYSAFPANLPMRFEDVTSEIERELK